MRSWMMLGPNDKTSTPITPATRFALGSLAAALVTEPDCFPLLVTALEDLPPWVPLVAVVPAHLATSLTALLTPLDQARAAQSVVVPHPLAQLPDAATLRQSVNQRPTVAPSTMAHWLARRLQQPAEVIEALLMACLDKDGSPNGASRRTLHRRVHEILSCRPSDLVRLHDLAILPRLADNTGQLAASAGTTITRLAQRVRRALGLTLANYNARPGWEWPLEAACRCGLGRTGGEWGVGSGEWGVGSGP